MLRYASPWGDSCSADRRGTIVRRLENGAGIDPSPVRRCRVPTYVYETIPQHAGEEPVRFEVRQGMRDPQLTAQPGTGKPVRRVLTGGFLLSKATHRSAGSVTDPSFHQRD